MPFGVARFYCNRKPRDMSPHASRGLKEVIAGEEKQTRGRGRMCFVKGSLQGAKETFGFFLKNA